MNKIKRLFATGGIATQILVLSVGGTLLYPGNSAFADDVSTVPVTGMITGPSGEKLGDNVVVDATSVDDASQFYEARVNGADGGSFGVDSPGSYELNLPAGTYDIVIQAVGDGMWQTITHSNVTVDSPMTLNAQMTPAIASHQLSGQVTTASDQPVVGAWVQVGAYGPTIYTQTDANGSYSVVVPDMTDFDTPYTVHVMDDNLAANAALGLPQHFNYFVSNTSLVLGTDAIKDIQLPDTTTLTIQVNDRDGNGAAGQAITYNGIGTMSNVADYNRQDEQDDAITDADGKAQVKVWSGPFYQPWVGSSNVLQVSFTDNYRLTKVSTADMFVDNPSLTVSEVDATPNTVAIPDDVTATTNADGTVTVHWTPEQPDSTQSYMVNRDGIQIMNNLAWYGDTDTWTDQHPLSGTHTYYVMAEDSVGSSSHSQVVTVTLP